MNLCGRVDTQPYHTVRRAPPSDPSLGHDISAVPSPCDWCRVGQGGGGGGGGSQTVTLGAEQRPRWRSVAVGNNRYRPHPRPRRPHRPRVLSLSVRRIDVVSASYYYLRELVLSITLPEYSLKCRITWNIFCDNNTILVNRHDTKCSRKCGGIFIIFVCHVQPYSSNDDVIRIVFLTLVLMARGF
ncbi:hypothetical protein J6590_049552 [Homalodisca vitripennis]|nr:hypothetical protein J6590_049552 [Homalodisca vitripennis]